MLEVIRNHDYRQSRFVRSATIDASELQDTRGAEATADASRERSRGAIFPNAPGSQSNRGS
jgi:hypothetical protein